MSKSKKVSEYYSEIIMNRVIEEVLENERYSNISYAMHQPLKLLIKDTSLLLVDTMANGSLLPLKPNAVPLPTATSPAIALQSTASTS